MSKRTVIYFDKIPEPYREVIERHTPQGFQVWYWIELDQHEQQEKLAEADYLLVVSKKLDAELLTHAKRARYIQRTGAGVNNIDVETATRLQLPVSTLPGGNSIAVAELTILMALSLYRKLPIVNQATKEGKWPNWVYRSHSYEMYGKTHGFIGFGNIGREAARRSKAFGTQIIYYDLQRVSEETERLLDAAYLPLEEVLKRSDILSIHVPLLETTRGMIGMKELYLMKPTAVLINVARGGIVKETDLYKVLSEGAIAGAAIDTWESEPVEPDNPLLRLDNVIATPHFAAGTIDTFEKVVQMAFDNMQQVEADNRPQYVVNGVEFARK